MRKKKKLLELMEKDKDLRTEIRMDFEEFVYERICVADDADNIDANNIIDGLVENHYLLVAQEEFEKKR